MDLFGFKKRKARKEAKRLEAEKLATLKIKRIKDEFQILKERVKIEEQRQTKQNQDLASWVNDKCPKCGSKNVNDRIKRLQGEFEGSLEGSMSGGLLYRSGYISGHSSGKIDTNPVNKCECGHEWKKRETECVWAHQVFESYFERLKWFLQDYHKAYTAKLNPNDLDEHFESDEEKRKALLKECDEGTRRENLLAFFKDIHLETIKETAEKEIWGDRWDDRHIKDFYEFWDEKILEEKLNIKPLPNLIGYVNVKA